MVETVTKWHWLGLSTVWCFRRNNAPDPTPFDAIINGSPTSTRIYYDNDTNEGCLPRYASEQAAHGKILVYNITRNSYRKLTRCIPASNYFFTETSIDNWADDDVITTLSQTAGNAFITLDISSIVPSNATAALMEIEVLDSTTYPSFTLYPHDAYGTMRTRITQLQMLTTSSFKTELMDVYDQKISMKWINVTSTRFYLKLFGYTTEINIPTPVTSRLVSPKGIRIP